MLDAPFSPLPTLLPRSRLPDNETPMQAHFETFYDFLRQKLAGLRSQDHPGNAAAVHFLVPPYMVHCPTAR